MIDILILASPIFLAWCLSYGILEPCDGVDADVRWNHVLSGVDPRRFRPPPCDSLEDLRAFEWEWDSVQAAVGDVECSLSPKLANTKRSTQCQSV